LRKISLGFGLVLEAKIFGELRKPWISVLFVRRGMVKLGNSSRVLPISPGGKGTEGLMGLIELWMEYSFFWDGQMITFGC
jgi:hypothetical protein